MKSAGMIKAQYDAASHHGSRRSREPKMNRGRPWPDRAASKPTSGPSRHRLARRVWPTRLGVDFGAPPDGNLGGSAASPADDISLDAASAGLNAGWFLLADVALRVSAPRATPILWPEHCDMAILLDEASHGASPGDAFHAMPYAYVSSGEHDGSGFWNAPFGAIRSRGADAQPRRARQPLARCPNPAPGPRLGISQLIPDA